ncbi:MAG: tetratricopeptide repeat protein [Bryobacterales bacterium]|nr:tetratricopeptide repeat protein [Bryobacterales bacterium]
MGSKAVLCVYLAVSCFAQTPPSKQEQIETHVRQANEFLKRNQPDLAVRELSAVVALDPNSLDARNNLGVLLYFRGDYPRAAPHLRAALKLRPDLARTQALLGMCERRMGEIARAETDLEQALPRLQEENPKIEAGMELIELYHGTGEFEKAVRVVGMLRQLKPADPDILYAAYRIYSTLTDEAVLSLAMSAPGSARLHQIQAHELARQGDTAGAIAHYREALKLEPQLPGAHFELAEMLVVARDEDGALKEYQAALSANPYDANSVCKLGEFAFRASDFKTAAEYYSRALRLQPTDVDASLGLARTLSAMNQPEKALPILERAAKTEPFDQVVRYRLAMAYRGLGRMEDSRRELAEFQRLKDMKEKLSKTYHEMRLRPKPERADPAVPE